MIFASKEKAEHQKTLLTKLEAILPEIDNEYHNLGQKATEIPLEEYESRYLNPISDYQKVKEENDAKPSMNKTALIVKGLQHYYYTEGSYINPYLSELIDNDIHSNTCSTLRKLKDIQEQTDDQKLSNSVGTLMKIMIIFESISILYKIYTRHSNILTTEDIKINRRLR